MNKGLIILSFVFILLIVASIIVYFIYEKPKQIDAMSESTYNLTLKFVSSNQQVATGYNINLDGGSISYKNGTTLLNDYLYLTLPVNHTFTISNYNIDNQKFYKIFKTFAPNDNSNIINNEIELIPYGTINISNDYSLAQSKNISLLLNISGEVRCINMCVRGSTHIVSIKSEYNIYKIPQRLKDKVDKCFVLFNNASNEVKNANILYSSFGELSQDDNIKVYIIDGDYTINSQCIDADTNNNDIAIEDIEYIIK